LDPAVMILFGNFGDGRTMRAFAAVAAFASLGAIVSGEEAERYSQVHRPASPLTGMPRPNLDYAATGSLEPAGGREIVTLRSCGDILGRR
jgi:hypothetical protein